ncbi:hypothetical protein NEOLEDRAFT_1066837 [Neolentinus lepideus HHB14362 ss-1]|uniref:Uncharacterized protein n=1 Tax=Neolentinus lepideus HHB14362 ss-1 TaxID=1314782 RepID=A0A165S6R2_9AGAM|nr:hypothetical protein NEOLEDRAFT_1066837 [Neolentinus lepideus HHB14362 ss-1]
MADVKALPLRCDKAAPVFDPENPRSLLCYLEDLEDLFKAHPTLITNEANKKHATIKYVPMHKEEMWKGLPEYEDTAKTYEEFVTVLKMLYPAVHKDQHYSMGDMDRLVGEHVCISIHNLADLSTFYHEFLLITCFFCRRDLISEREQNRTSQCTFSQDLWTKVYMHLQIKNPEQVADTPYSVASVFEAASFFLAGMPATTIMEVKAETPEGKVKVEEYTSLVDIIMKAVSQSLAPMLAAMAQGSTMVAGNTPACVMPTAPYQCHYCSANDHSIWHCPKVDDDQNIEEKVVLPSGIMVPQNLPGANMHERIMEWHRCNPSQVAANIIEQMIYEDVKTVGAPRDIFQLDVNERIKLLEKELFALRKCPTFNGLQVPPHPDKGKPPALPINVTPSAPAVPEKTIMPAPGPLMPSKLHDLPPHMPNAPIHLYAQACDINRPCRPAPKTVHFDMSQEKIVEAEQARSKELAYHVQAPVYDPVISENVFQRSLSTPYVSLTSQELLVISPEVRNKYCDHLMLQY